MRPSDKKIEALRPALGHLTDLYVHCFEKFLKEVSNDKEVTQIMVDGFFMFFIAGMKEVMTPGSEFNIGWKTK